MPRGLVSRDNELADPLRPLNRYNRTTQEIVTVGYQAKRTSHMIRDYLTGRVDYEMNIYRALKDMCDREKVRFGSYDSFEHLFRRLVRLELILPATEGDIARAEPSTARRPATDSTKERRYWKVDPNRLFDPAWDDPTAALGY